MYCFPCLNPYSSDLQLSLMLIRKALSNEKADKLFYEYLLQEAPNPKEKKIIENIRDDEIKHFEMFRTIYIEITGKEPVPIGNQEFEKPENYLRGLEEALFGELNTVEMYREIYNGLTSKRHRDMLFEIITDELKHANKWNFLYTLNYSI